MKILGALALILGICWVVFALNMDVSIVTGDGSRANSTGLMSERQNYTVVGCMAALSGLLLILFGGAKPAAHFEPNTRFCPYCAEIIKTAAIKCKHCAAEVKAVSMPWLLNGWVASIPCMAGEEQEHARFAVTNLGMPLVPMLGSAVGAGPFVTKDEARYAQGLLRHKHKTYSEIMYKDTASAKFKSVITLKISTWALAIPCRQESDRERATAAAERLELPFLSNSAAFIRFGPFLSKLKAAEMLRQLGEKGVLGSIEEIRKP